MIVSTFPFKSKKKKRKKEERLSWKMRHAKAWKKLKFKMFRLLGMKIGKAKKVFRINSEVIE